MQTRGIVPSASFSEDQLVVNEVPGAAVLLEGLKLHEGELEGGGVVVTLSTIEHGKVTPALFWAVAVHVCDFEGIVKVVDASFDGTS